MPGYDKIGLGFAPSSYMLIAHQRGPQDVVCFPSFKGRRWALRDGGASMAGSRSRIKGRPYSCHKVLAYCLRIHRSSTFARAGGRHGAEQRMRSAKISREK